MSNAESEATMAVRLVISPEAATDIGQAYDWYECRRAGLGEDFLTSLDACIQTICRNPEMHAKAHEDYRRALMRRFPYAVFYECTAGVVTVYCVFHTSRNPKQVARATLVNWAAIRCSSAGTTRQLGNPPGHLPPGCHGCPRDMFDP